MRQKMMPLKNLEDHGIDVIDDIWDNTTSLRCSICKTTWEPAIDYPADPDFRTADWECPSGCNKEN